MKEEVGRSVAQVAGVWLPADRCVAKQCGSLYDAALPSVSTSLTSEFDHKRSFADARRLLAEKSVLDFPFDRVGTDAEEFFKKLASMEKEEPLKTTFGRESSSLLRDLGKVALLVMSAPATTADAERGFSAASHFDDPYRNRMPDSQHEKQLVVRHHVRRLLNEDHRKKRNGEPFMSDIAVFEKVVNDVMSLVKGSVASRRE